MAEAGGKRLSTEGKASLLARMRDRVVQAAAAAPVLVTPSGRTAPRFDELPAYVEIARQKAVADMLGVASPFFRVQEGRGAPIARIGGRDVLNFASYDYLGLNQHPAVASAAEAAIRTYGTSTSASRLVAGERPVHRALEQRLAQVYGAEDAVVMVSGHGTNVATIGELMGPKDLVLTDALAHSSILVGARLAGATRRSFAHGDLDQLEAMLTEAGSRFERILIVVEGLYSMDGDTADLARLVEIKSRYGAWLMVDEAHALGTLGSRGRGLAEHLGIDPAGVDIWMGTLSKSLAGCGGYIAGAAALATILKGRASGFVYSVGLSPPLAAASLAALELIGEEPDRVARVQANGRLFLAAARSAGLDTGAGEGHAICPIHVGDSLRAVRLSEILLTRGLNALPIIYPAVPMQSARLRFFLTSEHTEAQIRTAVDLTRQALAELEAEGVGLATTLIARGS